MRVCVYRCVDTHKKYKSLIQTQKLENLVHWQSCKHWEVLDKSKKVVLPIRNWTRDQEIIKMEGYVSSF